MNNKLTSAAYRKPLQVITLLVFTIIIVIFAKQYIHENNTNHQSDIDGTCIFSENQCEVRWRDIVIEATLSPQVMVEEEITLTVLFSQPVTVESLYIEGVNMYMGKIPIIMDIQEKKHIQGWFMLGSCSEPAMTWRVSLKLKDRPQPVFFEFTTYS